ncbi:hypothetical protein F2P81_011949 [Scophthalmus maximus]|uniref:Uncharacterized protein n=1 Tax=Scophthalmus maximus TaxID=52904 RepID=A0A6A4ST79_SCOMX|nr:hypothetical protein F2P81_011949 [Scophthalmus maximus]
MAADEGADPAWSHNSVIRGKKFAVTQVEHCDTAASQSSRRLTGRRLTQKAQYEELNLNLSERNWKAVVSMGDFF